MPERGVTEEDLGRVRELADLFDGDDPVGALDAASLRTLLSAFEAAEQRAEDAEAALARAEERERGYREALEVIRDHGTDNGHKCWALHRGDCADVFQETARAALSTSPDTETRDCVHCGGTPEHPASDPVNGPRVPCCDPIHREGR